MSIFLCRDSYQVGNLLATHKLGTCESFFSFESNLELAVRFVFESNLRIESAIYHASRNTA